MLKEIDLNIQSVDEYKSRIPCDICNIVQLRLNENTNRNHHCYECNRIMDIILDLEAEVQ